jgi:hypothetical protein
MDARYPLPPWPANTPPNRRLGIACALAVTRNTLTRGILAELHHRFPSSRRVHPGECGNAGREDRRRRLRPHGRSHQATRHRRHGRDGPIKYPRDRPIFEPSHRRSGAAHATSHCGRSPGHNGQIGQIRPARQASGKAVGAPVLKLWNESRTNRARIADSVIVGIRSRRHLVARPLRATKSCKRSKRREPSMAEWINGEAWR